MRSVTAILLLLLLLSGCDSPGSALLRITPFPPQTDAELQAMLQKLAPIQIPPGASDIQVARVQRPRTAPIDLFAVFIAFRCSPDHAEQIIRTDSPRDNSVRIQPNRVTVTDDPDTSTGRPIITPARFPLPPMFPDVFFEGHDLSRCQTLSIRVAGAPEWFTPHQMRSGIADRCVWNKGHLHMEFYYDKDRQTMFLRLEELQPE